MSVKTRVTFIAADISGNDELTNILSGSARSFLSSSFCARHDVALIVIFAFWKIDRVNYVRERYCAPFR